LKVWVGPPDARKQRRIRLGHPRPEDGTPVLTLAQARDKARETKRLAAEGKPLTPSDPGHDGAEAGTFGTLAAAYLKHLTANARASTVKEAQRVLTHKDLADWRDRLVATITGDEVRRLRDKIADRGATIQSNRTLARLSALFNWALSENRIAASPAAGIKKRIKEEDGGKPGAADKIVDAAKDGAPPATAATSPDAETATVEEAPPGNATTSPNAETATGAHPQVPHFWRSDKVMRELKWAIDNYLPRMVDAHKAEVFAHFLKCLPPAVRENEIKKLRDVGGAR
jgi:hypothetical protein